MLTIYTGIKNPNWMDDQHSTDPAKKEEYEKNLALYQKAHDDWEKTVDNIMYEKVYYDKDGKEVTPISTPPPATDDTDK